MAHLRDNGKSKFGTMREQLKFKADGNLAWHIKVLKNAGFVKTFKDTTTVPTTTSKKKVSSVPSIAAAHKRPEYNVVATKKGMKSMDEFTKFISVLIPA